MKGRQPDGPRLFPVGLTRSPALPGSGRSRFVVIDVLRGVTILWVTLMHFYIDVRGVPGRDASPAGALDALTRGDLAELLAVIARSLVGLPGFRLDVLLFVTGLVLCLGWPVASGEFLRRRARSILPSYWLGSLAAAGLLVVLAALRSWAQSTPLVDELSHGTLLARAPYAFEWPDLVRSLSVLGRFEDARTMQVVAPSLWYLMLVGQLYLVFPWLRLLLDRVGPASFLALCTIVTIAGRVAVFSAPPLAGFDANATVICFLPFRLYSAALGMVAARGLSHIARPPRPPVAAAAAAPAVAAVLVAAWLGIGMNRPSTTLGALGPIVPLTVALPGLWMLAVIALRVPVLERWFSWAGSQSLSLLVVQDFLRLTVGTALVFNLRLEGFRWWLAVPIYLATAFALAGWWERLQARVTAKVWPEPPRASRGEGAVARSRDAGATRLT